MKLYFLLVIGFAFSINYANASGSKANPLESIQGNYHGTVSLTADRQTKEILVTTLTSWDGNTALLEVRDSTAGSSQIWKYSLSKKRKTKAVLTGLGTEDIELKADDDTCMSNADVTVRVCSDTTSLLLEVRDSTGTVTTKISLLSDKNSDNASLVHPTKVYSLVELRSEGMEHSFDTQVEFEHAFQARKLAIATRLNMFPHVSIGSIIPLSVADMSATLGAVGDLMPFLLPSRWLLKRANNQLSDAEADTLVIVKANSGFQAENIGLGILRDQEMLQKLKKSLTEITTIRDELAFREKLGQFPAGLHDDISSLIVSIQKTVATMTEGIQEEYATLAQACGFKDMTVIQGLEPLTADQLLPVQPVTDDSSNQMTLNNAYELKQLDHLILASKASRNARWFNWMDPAGDPAGGLGIALPAYVQIGTSQIREMGIRHSQMESILIQKLHTLTKEANLAVDQYTIDVDATALQKRRVDRLKNNIKYGAAFALSDLINALQDQVQNDLDLTNQIYTYMISRSALNRLEMTGPYVIH